MRIVNDDDARRHTARRHSQAAQHVVAVVVVVVTLTFVSKRRVVETSTIAALNAQRSIRVCNASRCTGAPCLRNTSTSNCARLREAIDLRSLRDADARSFTVTCKRSSVAVNSPRAAISCAQLITHNKYRIQSHFADT
jgi:hypothetical protein